MKIIHSLDSFNRGGIADLILRFGEKSSHTHNCWGYRGTLSEKMDDVGMKTFEGGPSPDDKYDVLVMHTVGAFNGRDVFVWAKDRGMKTVECMHSVYTSPTPPELCDMFVAVSHMAENRNLHFPKHRTIHPYLDVSAFKFKTEFSPSDKIGRLSRIVDEKRPQDFAEMAKIFSDEQFIMAGDGNLLEYLKSMNIPNLEFTGWVYDQPKFLSGLKLFVFPSRDECYSIAAASAQAAGIPIICQEIPQLRESTGGYAWFANNKQEFIELIKKYLSNPESYTLTKDARAWVNLACNNIETWDGMINEITD